MITQVHQDSRGIYGGRRVHAELTLGRGIEVGHNQVELLMRRAGLRGVTGRRKWKRSLPESRAVDLVERNFTRPPFRTSCGSPDVTEHPTREEKVCCCAVLDTYSRRIVGWSIDASPNAALVTNALGMAIDARLTKSGRTGMVIHSDEFVQFGSWVFTQRARASGLLASMGSISDCYDNSMIESVLVPHASRAS